jgi:2-amino-4-hydroxy-6-hydroxymethyldihydropteridine diphosphokinase
MNMEDVFLLLGSNRGDRLGCIQRAREMVAAEAGHIFVSSAVYESQPWGFYDSMQFLNQVVGIHTNLPPEVLLELLLSIEIRLGRVRSVNPAQCGIDGCELTPALQPYEGRIIDIDILFYGSRLVFTDRLMIPHPRLHERLFTLIPLNEVAPQFQHPLLKKTIFVLLKECADHSGVKISDKF